MHKIRPLLPLRPSGPGNVLCMQLVLIVHGAPYCGQASLSAFAFAQAALHAGHEIPQVFFYGDAVHHASPQIHPPADERETPWPDFAAETGIELVICSAAAQRRGLVQDAMAMRQKLSAAGPTEIYQIGGLGQLMGALLAADRVLEFHP